MEEASSAPISSPAWSELLPDVLGRVIALLPFPADRARFRAVCRGWHYAAREHVRRSPWIVLPSCSFCVFGDDDYLHRIPGLPENVTCLGAAGEGWLAIDRTDDTFRRTSMWKHCDGNPSFTCRGRTDVKFRHSYMLHNPFTGETVPLPELDTVVGHVSEAFEIRKVLMRSSGDPHDIVAVLTNNDCCNVVLCRPGTGRKFVVSDVRVFDVEFSSGGNKLYGITPEEELVVFDLAEDNDDLYVTRCRRVIKKPYLADDGEEDPWSWMYDDDEEDDDDDENNNGGENNDDENNNGEPPEEEDEHEPEEEEEEYSYYDADGDMMMSDGRVILRHDEEVPTAYGFKDQVSTVIVRRLVRSRGGELLMVKQYSRGTSVTSFPTRKVEVFKADIDAGTWVPVMIFNAGIADQVEEEAIFLSRTFSTCTPAYGDIKDRFVYSLDTDDVFDMRSSRALVRPDTGNRLAPQTAGEALTLLTWLFPPQELVV